MKKLKRLYLKDRLTIYIKKTKPIRLSVLLILAAVLLCSIVAMGLLGGNVSRTSAPNALTNDDVKFRMTIAGDITVDDNTRQMAESMSYSKLLRGVSKYWADADAVVANFSGPVLRYKSENYTSRKSAMEESVYMRPAALRGFLDAGITLPSFANDEAFNYGISGLRSTLSLLEEYNAEYLGITADSTQPYYKTFEFAVAGEQTGTVSVLSVNDIIQSGSSVSETRPGVINSSNISIYETIYELSETSDLLVVYAHFGEVNSNKISKEQRALAQALIDAGADLVVGTNTHLVQPIERYNNGLIVYGLGELLSTEDYSFSCDGALLDVTVQENGEMIAYFTPTHITEGRPVVTNNWLYRNRIEGVLTNQLADADYSMTEDGMIAVSLGQMAQQ